MEYCDRMRYGPDIADAIWIVIHKMDIVEREWRIEELKQESGGGN